jgi:methionyl-tRNA synthetase
VPLDDPDAAGKALYVWFDAPIGYVSFTEKLCEQRRSAGIRTPDASRGPTDDYTQWWKSPDCKIAHFIGEDNTVFHALIWPAMLMAESSFQLPWQVVANAFLNIKFPGQEEQKISKSRGTAIWIEEYLKTFEPDPLRYYLTAIAPENQRTTFDVDDFITRNNTELLNVLGNFVNRTLTFACRYFEAKVPEAGRREAVDQEHVAAITRQVATVTQNLEEFHFRNAMAELMALARLANVYFDTKQPWKQRKDDMAACGTTINVCIQTVKALTVLMTPFLPTSGAKCAEMLKLNALTWDDATKELPTGHPLAEPAILFKKLDPAELFGSTD